MIQLEAVYENGVFRPLQPVQLPEQQHVTVTIEEESDMNAAAIGQTHFALSVDRWQAFCNSLDTPPKNLPNLKKLSLFDGNGTSAP